MNQPFFTRRRALQLMGVAAVAPFSPAWAAQAERPLTFLAVGDWGRDGAYRQSEVAAQMGVAAAKIDAKFVISVGDNFYDAGVDGVDDPKWRTSFEDIYKAPSLQKPWHAALGNHDYYGDPQAQVDYAVQNPSGRWRMPNRFHAFQETSPDGVVVGVFVLDTTPLITDYYANREMAAKLADRHPAAQLAWFDKALGASNADWKIVVGHHPIWSGDNSMAGRQGHWGSPDLVAKVDPILRKHGVYLYLNGHDHQLQHTARGGVHYVCTGAGSKTETACDDAGSDLCSLESGFVAVAATRDRLKVGYRDWKGAELRVVEIGRA